MAHRHRTVLQVEQLETRINPILIREVVSEFLLNHDVNHDKKVSYGLNREVTDPSLVQCAIHIDRNQDQLLSRAEVKRFLRHDVDLDHNKEISDPEIAFLFFADPNCYAFFFPRL